MKTQTQTPAPKRGIIADAKFLEKWKAFHRAAGDPNPEAKYIVQKKESPTPKK